MMLEQQAVVTRIEGLTVEVKSLQTSACGHCQQQDSCGTALYTKLLPDRAMQLSSQIALEPGDQVIVGIEERHLLIASLLMYLLPLLIMLISVGLFQGSDKATAIVAVTSLALGLYTIHRLQYALRRLIAPPQILRKC